MVKDPEESLSSVGDDDVEMEKQILERATPHQPILELAYCGVNDLFQLICKTICLSLSPLALSLSLSPAATGDKYFSCK